MAESDCNVTAETAEMPGYLVEFAMAVEKWVDGTQVEWVETDEIEAWWREAWAELIRSRLRLTQVIWPRAT